MRHSYSITGMKSLHGDPTIKLTVLRTYSITGMKKLQGDPTTKLYEMNVQYYRDEEFTRSYH